MTSVFKPKGPALIFVGLVLILLQLGLVTSIAVAVEDPSDGVSPVDPLSTTSNQEAAFEAAPPQNSTAEAEVPVSGGPPAAPPDVLQEQPKVVQPVDFSQTPPQRVETEPGLEAFVAQVANGQANVVTGLYVPGVMALRVVPQPVGDSAYISSEDNTATIFQDASLTGSVGLLAHNYLSGSLFYNLSAGQELSLVYGDGRVRRYRLEVIAPFERLSLGDLSSDFLDLQTGLTLSAQQVFDQFYSGDVLTLQTCLEKDGVLNWGVTFFVGIPIE